MRLVAGLCPVPLGCLQPSLTPSWIKGEGRKERGRAPQCLKSVDAPDEVHYLQYSVFLVTCSYFCRVKFFCEGNKQSMVNQTVLCVYACLLLLVITRFIHYKLSGLWFFYPNKVRNPTVYLLLFCHYYSFFFH